MFLLGAKQMVHFPDKGTILTSDKSITQNTDVLFKLTNFCVKKIDISCHRPIKAHTLVHIVKITDIGHTDFV